MHNATVNCDHQGVGVVICFLNMHKKTIYFVTIIFYCDNVNPSREQTVNPVALHSDSCKPLDLCKIEYTLYAKLANQT